MLNDTGRGITAPGVTRDIITSRYGPRIDLGPIFAPRSTGVDPMTGDPFKQTIGVGGFFRRLLGDNSNELNADWQRFRMQDSMAKQALQDERSWEMQKLDKQQQNELERARYATEIGSQARLAEAAANRADQRAYDAAAPAREHQALTTTLGDPVAATNYMQKTAENKMAQEEAKADLMKSQADYWGGRNDTTLDSALMRGAGAGGRSTGAPKHLGEGVFQVNGGFYRVDPETQKFVQIPFGGGGPGGISDETRAEGLRLAEEMKNQNDLAAPAADPSLFSQLGSIVKGGTSALGEAVPQGFKDAASSVGETLGSHSIIKGYRDLLGGPSLDINPLQKQAAALQRRLDEAKRRKGVQ